MKQYSLTSLKFDGEFLLTYNTQKLLIKFEAVNNPSAQTIAHMLKFLPLTTDELEELKTKSSTLNVTEVAQEVTFEMFWNRYNDKVRSSKKRCERMWNKLSQGDQLRAYNHIPVYMRSKGNAEKKYCETYLSAELWNN